MHSAAVGTAELIPARRESAMHSAAVGILTTDMTETAAWREGSTSAGAPRRTPVEAQPPAPRLLGRVDEAAGDGRRQLPDASGCAMHPAAIGSPEINKAALGSAMHALSLIHI